MKLVSGIASLVSTPTFPPSAGAECDRASRICMAKKFSAGRRTPAGCAPMRAQVLAFALFCLATGMTGREANAQSVSTPAPSAGQAKPAKAAPLAKPQAVYPTLHPLPVMDPRKVLPIAVLRDALRRGGLVLYLRHTETGVITPQCETSNLTPRGEADAVRIGQTIRELKLPIGKIFSSDICRVRATARLLDLGAVEITEDLTNMPKHDGHEIHAARAKLLATPPAAGAHNLLVSHIHGGDREDQAIYLDLGEIIVYRPNSKGGSDAVARIRLEDWSTLSTDGKLPSQQAAK